MADILLIIPTYDEKENIERLVQEIFGYEIDLNILVVDDNSPDGTGQRVKNLQNDFKDRYGSHIPQGRPI